MKTYDTKPKCISKCRRLHQNTPCPLTGQVSPHRTGGIDSKVNGLTLTPSVLTRMQCGNSKALSTSSPWIMDPMYPMGLE